MAVVSFVLVASSKANLPERNHRLLFAQNTLRYPEEAVKHLTAEAPMRIGLMPWSIIWTGGSVLDHSISCKLFGDPPTTKLPGCSISLVGHYPNGSGMEFRPNMLQRSPSFLAPRRHSITTSKRNAFPMLSGTLRRNLMIAPSMYWRA